MKSNLLIGLLIAAVLPSGFAQPAAPVSAVVIYFEGEEFEVRDRRGDPIAVEDPIGWELHEGDVVITYDRTFVELQLLPSRNVVKIAENTNFRLESLGEARESRFGVLYGSARAKVQGLARDERFRIRGSAAIAGVRGTDFGVDVIVQPDRAGTEAVTEVYCFEGEVEVQPQLEGLPEGRPEPAPIILRQDQMVSVAPPPAAPGRELRLLEGAAALQVVPIRPQIRSYWQDHPFQGQPLEPPARGERGGKVRARPVGEGLTAEAEKMWRSRILAGGAFFLSGVLLEGAGMLSLSLQDRGAAWGDAGVIMVGGGLFCVGSGLLSLLSAHLIRSGAEIGGPGGR